MNLFSTMSIAFTFIQIKSKGYEKVDVGVVDTNIYYVVSLNILYSNSDQMSLPWRKIP